MSTRFHLRAFPRARKGLAAAVAAGCVATLATVGSSAAAELAPRPVFEFTGLGAGGGFVGGTAPAGHDGILGNADDADAFGLAWGGQIQGPVDTDASSSPTSTYCIDISTPIDIGGVTALGSWSDAVAVTPPDGRTNLLTLDNLRRIAQIVTNNFPNDDSLVPLAGSDNDKALAVQMAIWHYANGYEPGTAQASINMGTFGVYNTTPATVAANYAALINAVETGIYPQADEPVVPYLEIDLPASTAGFAGGAPVGPFTVLTNPGIPVTATPSGDAAIVDSTGAPLTGPFFDGDQLYLAKPSTGSASLALSASMAIPVGSTYVTADVQRLVNATEVIGMFNANAAATFSEAPLFDLALRKTLSDGQSTTVRAGDKVRFSIEVFNQGEAAATDIRIVDRLPAGTVLADDAWTDEGDGTVTHTIDGPLPAGSSIRVEITMHVSETSPSGVLVNTAEIAAANDAQGHPAFDVDSTPDTNLDNDVLVDDFIDSTPHGNPADEDDHDIAQVTVAASNLALSDSLDLGGTAAGSPDQWSAEGAQLAFTGSATSSKALVGLALVIVGIALTAVRPLLAASRGRSGRRRHFGDDATLRFDEQLPSSLNR